MGSTVVLSVQDDLLRQAVEVYGGKNWKKIGAFLNFQTRRNRESRAFERALDVRAKRRRGIVRENKKTDAIVVRL